MHTPSHPHTRRDCLTLLAALPAAYAVGPGRQALEACPPLPQPSFATVIVLDLSRSMGLDNRLDRARALALTLVQALTAPQPGHGVALVGMEEYAYPLTPTALPRVTWRDTGLGTNLHHALQVAQALLHPSPHARRQVLILTDGEPTAHLEDDGTAYFTYPPTRRTLERTFDAVERCAQARIRLHPFLFDADPWVTRWMAMMADTTQGHVFHVAPLQPVGVTLSSFLATIHARPHA